MEECNHVTVAAVGLRWGCSTTWRMLLTGSLVCILKIECVISIRRDEYIERLQAFTGLGIHDIPSPELWVTFSLPTSRKYIMRIWCECFGLRSSCKSRKTPREGNTKIARCILRLYNRGDEEWRCFGHNTYSVLASELSMMHHYILVPSTLSWLVLLV